MAIRKMVLASKPPLKLKDAVGDYQIEVRDVFGLKGEWVQVKLQVTPEVQDSDLDSIVTHYGTKTRRAPKTSKSGDSTTVVMEFDNDAFNFEPDEKPGGPTPY